jgi:hypothetical protein
MPKVLGTFVLMFTPRTQTVFQSRIYVFGSLKYDFWLSSWKGLPTVL